MDRVHAGHSSPSPGAIRGDGSGDPRDVQCADCFGREVFEGADPEASVVPAELQKATRRPLRLFLGEHRVAVGFVIAAAVITAFVVGVLPQITGIDATLRRVGQGDPAWLLLGMVFEAISIAGYIMLFRSVFSCDGTRIGWRASYEITLAGVVATKLLAAAGAGGLALTAWALRSSGLSGRTIARRMAGFEILLYALFMLTLVIVGVGLGSGAFGVHAPWTVSYLPALFGAVAIALALAAGLLPARAEAFLSQITPSRHRLARILARLAKVPLAVRDGLVTAAEIVKAFDPATLGAIVYWGFDIAALWVSFRAFGATIPVAVVIMGYFVGQLANAIPLPGGIGGVEGGMIGCFLALGVNASAAIIAVFAYRAISFWLPTLPGLLAYLQLRRRISGWRAAENGAESAVI